MTFPIFLAVTLNFKFFQPDILNLSKIAVMSLKTIKKLMRIVSQYPSQILNQFVNSPPGTK